MNVQTRFSDKLEWVERHGRLVLRKAKIDPRTKTVTIFTNAIRAIYPSEFEARLASTIEAARARALGDGNWDEDEHPRDEDGKFTHGGGGSTSGNDGADAAVVGAKEPELHPETIDVTGDEWNKETAIRLEKEYQTVKPDLEALIHKSVGEEVDTAVDEEDLNDNAPVVPDSWEMLGDQQQDDVKSKWIDNSKQEFIDNEENSWIENGGQKDDAQVMVAQSDVDDWAKDTVTEWMQAREENGNPVPYFSADILNSISVTYDPNGEGTGDVTIEFDNEMLKDPKNYDPNQGLLPGIEPIDPSSYFSIEMRDELEKELEKAFDKQADELISDGKVEVPDYVAEQAVEFMDEYWDQKDDDEKFAYAKDNTDIIDQAQQEYDQYFENNGNSGVVTEVAIPNSFDPLQQNNDTADYKKTHALVTFMSRERAYKLLEQRGLVKEGVDKGAYTRAITATDNELWRDWKESSAGSFGGQILQLASHEELGARYRDMPTHRDDLIKQADAKWKHLGGFAGIKAMVRAKWETSQYALDKAGIHSLPVYRGLKVDMPADEPTEKISIGKDTVDFDRFTNAQITRNGCYSTTTDRGVANGWNAGSGGTKVVLRIDAPRTAVLSFPAYGINVHSEKEVVLAGTAFRNWDAWKGRAPADHDVPINKGKAA